MAEEKPEGTIFIIPVKLEEVEVPKRLTQWQWANLFQEGGYQLLVQALNVRASAIGVTIAAHETRESGEAERLPKGWETPDSEARRQISVDPAISSRIIAAWSKLKSAQQRQIAPWVLGANQQAITVTQTEGPRRSRPRPDIFCWPTAS